MNSNYSQHKTLVVLTGPTAVGKTELSIKLAKMLGSPIISADSRQIYKEMQIGTASPTPSQLAQVEHHFVCMLALDDYYSAARYEEDALKLIGTLLTTHDTLLMTGGSMMYIDAVCNGIDDVPTIETSTREFLKQKLASEGELSMLEELRLLDPAYYQTVDHRNTKRVVHALEIYYQTGRPFSSFRTGMKKTRDFNIVKIGLNRDRSELFERINRRVDAMIEAGLLDEARRLYPFRSLNSLNTVGYKEMFKVIDGEWDLPFAVERMKKNTRVYAKKQLTWLRKDPEITWVCLNTMSENEIFEKIFNLIG